jgi:prophage DNA circulation protein
MEADVWGEDGARMAKNLYDTMEERYPGELDPTWGWVRDIIMTYWRNWIWTQDYAYVK